MLNFVQKKSNSSLSEHMLIWQPQITTTSRTRTERITTSHSEAGKIFGVMSRARAPRAKRPPGVIFPGSGLRIGDRDRNLEEQTVEERERAEVVAGEPS